MISDRSGLKRLASGAASRLTAFAGVAVALAVVAAACATSAPDVATLEDQPELATSGSNQAMAAEAMVDCLRSLGVPVELNRLSDGQAELGFEGGERWRLCQSQDGMCHFGGGSFVTEAQLAAEEEPLDTLELKYRDEMASPRPGTRGAAMLLAGTTDYTEQYRQCGELIDYVPPTQRVDPAWELSQKQTVADATNKWIECARSSGQPNLADVLAPKADNFKTYPRALLPVTTTPNQLRALLGMCPLEDFGNDGIWPNVSVDAPGYDGRGPLRDAEFLDAKTADAVGDLMVIISDATPY